MIIWDDTYLPKQTIIFRDDKRYQINLIYYFKLDKLFIAIKQKIDSFRTKTEEEKLFQIARLGLVHLMKFNVDEKKIMEELTSTLAEDDSLNQLLDEVFLSDLAMSLMRTKSPDYGFYSFSPNLSKLERMIHGEEYSLLRFIQNGFKKIKES